MKFYVYILVSQVDYSRYIGQTQSMEGRIEMHNQGYIQSTASKRPWKLLAYKIVDSRSESVVMERKLKNLKSTERMMEFLNRNEFRFE